MQNEEEILDELKKINQEVNKLNERMQQLEQNQLTKMVGFLFHSLGSFIIGFIVVTVVLLAFVFFIGFLTK